MSTELLDRPVASDGVDAPAPGERRRKAVVVGSALLVALVAGAALAFFLTTRSFGQQVTGEALAIDVAGLESMFDGDGIQPGRVLSGSFTASNTNDVPIAYTLGSETAATGLALDQYRDLEVRLCTSESGYAFVLPIPGTEETSTTCGGWQALDGLELELGEFAVGQSEEFGLQLRLKETGQEQPDDVTTDWDFVVEARSIAS
jgi:hypothetical protein